MRARYAVLALGLALAGLALGWGCQSHPKGAPQQYQVYCARCHGARGEGDPKARRQNPAADLLVSEMMRRGDRATIRRRIAAGYGPMPGFSRRLSPAEIERMIDFILRLPQTQRKGD